MQPAEMHELVSQSVQTLPAYLQERTTPVWLKSGEVVMEKGEPIRYAYLLLLGDMVVVNEFEDGNYYSFAHLRAGRYLGDLEVLSGKLVSAATVIILKDTFALRFAVEDFMKCLDEDIAFLKIIARSLAGAMFGSSSERGYNHYRQGVDKLVRLLTKYYKSHSGDAQVKVEVAMTRQEIASEIGITVKTVNRSVAVLKEEGAIHIRKGKIQITWDGYRKLAERLSPQP